MTSASDKALETYRALLTKVDEKFAEIRGHHPASLQCRLGCHSCCKPGLTLSPVEAAALRQHFDAHPEARARAKALRTEDPHRGTRCRLLDAQGACVAYDARPLVCRSHGVPLRLRDSAGERLDVCPLNFADQDLAALPAGDSINLETLNTILSLLNQQFTGGASMERSPIDRDA